MAGLFGSIPQRGYNNVLPSWFNALQAAGAFLEGLIGAGSGGITQTSFTFANNQGSAAVITALSFDSAVCLSAKVWISVRRSTGTHEYRSEVELWLAWSPANSAWEIVDQVEHAIGGQAGTLTFTVVTTGTVGQLKYTSTNVSGTGYSGVSTFSALTAN
jgi:hypothetical protein